MFSYPVQVSPKLAAWYAVDMVRKEPKRIITTYVTVKGLARFGGRTIDSTTGEERRCTKTSAVEAAKCSRTSAQNRR